MARSELARVAEQAFNESMNRGCDFRDAMQNVADAVVHESRTDGLEAAMQDVLKSSERKLAERKVIEAAQRYRHDPQGLNDPIDHPSAGPKQELFDAVDALEAEEE